MVRYAEELQKLWDDALVTAARNNRGNTMEAAEDGRAATNSGAEVMYQARDSKNKDVISIKEQIKRAEDSLNEARRISGE